jgi:hypothetical protein
MFSGVFVGCVLPGVFGCFSCWGGLGFLFSVYFRVEQMLDALISGQGSVHVLKYLTALLK